MIPSEGLELAEESSNLAYAVDNLPSCAGKIYQRILELSPNNHRALNKLASFYHHQKEDLEKSEKLYLLAIKHAPEDPQFKFLCYRTLGDLYAEKGEYEHAHWCYIEALDLKDVRGVKINVALLSIAAF